MEEHFKTDLHKHLKTWLLSFLLIAVIGLETWNFVGTAYAVPADNTSSYQVLFVDENGEPFKNDDGTEVTGMTKTLKPEKKITVPKIKKKWLPSDTKDNDQIVPVWNIPDTDITVYPGDELWYEDYADQVSDGELRFYLVPNEDAINSDTSAVFFYTADGEEIEEYSKPNIKIGKTITLPDPGPYGGKFWLAEDDDGNRMLYKKGESYRVTEYSGEFVVGDSSTVAIKYLYPVDQDTADGHSPGDIYYTDSAKVGDYIIVKGSPGNILFGQTFRGWEETNGLYDGILTAGTSIQITSTEDLEFMPYYEEDPNWDPTDAPENMLPDGMTDEKTRQLEENAGAGVNLSLSNNPEDGSYGGKLTKDGGSSTKFGSNSKNNTMQNGDLMSGTRKDATLTNTAEDQYGRIIEGGDGDPSKALVQDDSLFGMDIYGNAFAYPYWESDEGKRKEIVTNRLNQYKGNSWVNFIEKHPELADAVSRFEEREFDLLKDDCTDKLALERRQWRGWMDYYSDIPESVVSANTGENDVWVNNQDGETNRLLARVKFSNSWENYTFYQYFYDPTHSTFSSYTFGGIGNQVTIDNLKQVYNQLANLGYSESAACAMCAIIWQNTNGSFSAEYDGSNGKGLWAWNADEVTNVRSIIAKNELVGSVVDANIDEKWVDLQVQTRALDSWINLNYHDLLNNAVGQSFAIGNTFAFSKTTNVQTAVDALCRVFRDGEDEQTDDAIKLPDGKYYKDAQKLREYASALKKALQKDEGGYTFDSSQLAGMNCSEIRRKLCEVAVSYVGKIPYISGGQSLQTGVDCSGFTMEIYKMFGVTLPRKSYVQATSGIKIQNGIEGARPGDLMIWRKPGTEEGHVAIYIGNNQHVHASCEKDGLKISTGESSSRGKVFLGYYSVFD